MHQFVAEQQQQQQHDLYTAASACLQAHKTDQADTHTVNQAG
jgi:hypothetical protein